MIKTQLVMMIMTMMTTILMKCDIDDDDLVTNKPMTLIATKLEGCIFNFMFLFLINRNKEVYR